MIVSTEVPCYSNRVLALNPESCQKFQCRNFFLNSRTKFSRAGDLVGNDAIHAAILDGRLIDITDQLDKYTSGKGSLIINQSEAGAAIDLGVTDKRFFLTRVDGEVQLDIPDSEEVRQQFEKANDARSLLILPPGMDNPEAYLIKI